VTRAALLARAEKLGRVSRDPDLHLIVDGEVVRAQSVADGTHRFAVPAGARSMLIASRSVVPAETEAGSAEPRRLGVPLKRVVLRGVGMRIEIRQDCPALRGGFHRDELTHRWTDGCGSLPPGLLDGFIKEFSVEVQIGVTKLHYPTDTPSVATTVSSDNAPAARRMPLRTSN
jgi:hypothetical protein